MTIKAILWDMDGTLADSEPLHDRAFEAALRMLDITPPDWLHEATLGVAEIESYELIVEKLGLKVDFDTWLGLRYDHFTSHAHQITPFEPALAIWHQAAAAGLKQAVVSNADRILLETNLRQTGLVRPGLISVSRNDVKDGKPAPEPYLRGAALLGIAPHEAVVVEDSRTGAAAGRAAGMEVFMAPGPHKTDADPGLDALAERLGLSV